MTSTPISSYEKIRNRAKTHTYFIKNFSRPRFSEIDGYGVLWNGKYIDYFETARLDLCRSFDFDMEILSKLGIFLPVYHYEVTMKKPVFPNDEIRVAVRPIELTETSMKFEHLLLVGSEIRATCILQHIAISKETGQILYSLPDEIKKVLSPLKEKYPHD